jgi:hypothetical protein
MMTGQIIPRAASKAHNLRECNKLPIGHQPQEAEGEELWRKVWYSTKEIVLLILWKRIRDTQQGCAKSRSKSRRRSLKTKHDRTGRSRSCILLHAIPHISLNMWAINNLRRPLLRRVTSMPPWAQLPPPPPLAPTLVHNQQPEGQGQAQQQHDTREESEARIIYNTVTESRHIY